MSPTSLALRFLQAYDTRSALFGADLFQAPAWDVLLHLAAAEDGLSRADLQQATAVPLPTLDRWLGLLEGRELIAGEPAARYRLTEAAQADMAKVLLSALDEQPA